MAVKLTRSHAVVVGVACLGLGTALGPTAAGAADALKDVVVQNTPSNPVPVAPQGTTQVDGSVEVGNLPLQDGAVKVTQSTRTLRSGHGDTFYASGERIVIPDGVVVTQVRAVGGNEISRVTAPCAGALRERDARGFYVDTLAEFVTNPNDPTDELSLEPGLKAGPGNTLTLEMEGIFSTNEGCLIFWNWSGYEG